MNFKVLVITDRPDYWFDYFREGLHDFCIISRCSGDIKAKNGFFSAKILRNNNDGIRGYDPDKIIFDKDVSVEDFCSISALLGHRKRIVFTKNSTRQSVYVEEI